MKITNKKEAYNLGYKNAENNVCLPHNFEGELLTEYWRGYDDYNCIGELKRAMDNGIVVKGE